MQKKCPCCSDIPYESCCKKYHTGSLPENALKLMRSRYAAYALSLADYIIDTTHPKNPLYILDKAAWKKSISQFSTVTEFLNLEIKDFQEFDNQATVTFTAHLMQYGRDASFTEKSSFKKQDSRWLYLNGEFLK